MTQPISGSVARQKCPTTAAAPQPNWLAALGLGRNPRLAIVHDDTAMYRHREGAVASHARRCIVTTA
jgi:hypothetical protein